MWDTWLWEGCNLVITKEGNITGMDNSPYSVERNEFNAKGDDPP